LVGAALLAKLLKLLAICFLSKKLFVVNRIVLYLYPCSVEKLINVVVPMFPKLPLAPVIDLCDKAVNTGLVVAHGVSMAQSDFLLGEVFDMPDLLVV
jgi:hypothetical protein